MSTLSTKFREIDTQLLIDEATSAAQSVGLTPTVYRGDKFSQLRFPELQTSTSGGLIPQVWIKNRNDGTSACSVMLGMFRLVCSNGLIVGVDEYRAKVRHIQGPKVEDFLRTFHAEVTGAFGRLESTIDNVIEMQAREIESSTAAMQIVGSLELSDRAKDAAIYRIATGLYRAEDAPSSAWGLYNIVNEMNRRAGRRGSEAWMEREETLASDIMALSDREFDEQAA